MPATCYRTKLEYKKIAARLTLKGAIFIIQTPIIVATLVAFRNLPAIFCRRYYPVSNFFFTFNWKVIIPCFLFSVRVLEEEIGSLRQEHNCCHQNLDHISGILQRNEYEMRTEEAKLSAARKKAALIVEKIRAVESQQEPESADVLVFVRIVRMFCYGSNCYH